METGEIRTLQLLKMAFEQSNNSKLFIDARTLLSRDQIDAANTPILFVELESGQNGTLTQYPGQGALAVTAPMELVLSLLLMEANTLVSFGVMRSTEKEHTLGLMETNTSVSFWMVSSLERGHTLPLMETNTLVGGEMVIGTEREHNMNNDRNGALKSTLQRNTSTCLCSYVKKVESLHHIPKAADR